MNHLESIISLKNSYSGLRHGEAESNVLGILVGDPHAGIDNYGLTENGKRQVRETVSSFKFPGRNLAIYSSDFKRAMESAKIAQEIISCRNLSDTMLLRERYFGDYEGCPDHESIAIIFENDRIKQTTGISGTESISCVQDRMTHLIKLLEMYHANVDFLLVSHCDPLRILEASFTGVPLGDYLTIPLLQNGEIREFRLER